MNNRFNDNPNLTLIYGNSYRELPILELYTPMLQQYLDRSHDVLFRALNDHTRVTGFRFDLHFADNQPLPACAFTNEAITSFINSLKSQIKQDRIRSAKKHKRIHDTKFHYIWCREIGDTGRPHYHVFIFVSSDCYDSLGNWEKCKRNMAYRVFHAWSRALGISVDQAIGLVQFSNYQAVYHVNRHDWQSIAFVYLGISYLCKAYSKQYAGWVHSFGCSH